MRRIQLTLGILLAGCFMFACQPEGDTETTATISGSSAESDAVVQTGASKPVVQPIADEVDPMTGFATNAFPPLIPDTEWHQEAWLRQDCLRCHETGVGDAPMIIHRGIPEIALYAKCRSCHVLVDGHQMPDRPAEEDSFFASNAFPPMMPNSESHMNAWTTLDCLMCHETGIMDAPIVIHDGLPAIYLQVKCRSCHVQVRSGETDPWGH